MTFRPGRSVLLREAQTGGQLPHDERQYFLEKRNSRQNPLILMQLIWVRNCGMFGEILRGPARKLEAARCQATRPTRLPNF